MKKDIDINFNFFSEIRAQDDPDSKSSTLRRYHKLLWSKPLPNGEQFLLEDTRRGTYLYHKSTLGEFFLNSDCISHSYKNRKKPYPREEVQLLYDHGSTVGAYIVFPGIRIDKKMTINGARGCHPKIGDRFDLTLECIRLHYNKSDNKLAKVLNRYHEFFSLFTNFKGYVDFFLLQDLVTNDYSQVNFHLPHNSFDDSPLPRNKEEYLAYKDNAVRFIKLRAERMERSLCP